MLFDWLVVGQVLPYNPASSVRGPKRVVKIGKTPVLSAKETRELLDGIDVSTIVGLRDRVVLGVLVYSFTRVSAAVALRVVDYYMQGERSFFRLYEKGGRYSVVPAHHSAQAHVDAYLDAAGIDADRRGPLLRICEPWRRDALRDRAMSRLSAFRMIRCRARAVGLPGEISAHRFRGTGITEYLRNGGDFEVAARIAGHESTRTTQLYNRLPKEISLEESERIYIRANLPMYAANSQQNRLRHSRHSSPVRWGKLDDPLHWEYHTVEYPERNILSEVGSSLVGGASRARNAGSINNTADPYKTTVPQKPPMKYPAGADSTAGFALGTERRRAYGCTPRVRTTRGLRPRLPCVPIDDVQCRIRTLLINERNMAFRSAPIGLWPLLAPGPFQMQPGRQLGTPASHHSPHASCPCCLTSHNLTCSPGPNEALKHFLDSAAFNTRELRYWGKRARNFTMSRDP